MAKTALISVDLEPNKDDTLDGVSDSMKWFDRTVPTGTVFATYRIAKELPDLLAELSESHEIGVHVHPREFGYEHDQLAELSITRQREVIRRTRAAITNAVGAEPRSFRAGRHSVSQDTLATLEEMGFVVDASLNVRYDQYLPKQLFERSEPFELGGLIEVPVTHGTLPLRSSCGIRAVFERPVTATAATIRADRWGCSGKTAVRKLADQCEVFSFYTHPYDATDHHSLENGGRVFRRRVTSLIASLESENVSFSTIGEVAEA